MHRRKHRVPGTLAVTLMMVAPASAEAAPKTISCVTHSTYGCANDSDACIFNLVRSSFRITFDFARGRYKSPSGSGTITQVEDAPDGTHRVYVSSPPAGAELIFSRDWTTARKGGERSGVTYRCESPRWSRG